ncbi:MAG: hypothetical protein ACXWQR_10420 [Ktedonobacterales bacterium]
MSTKHRTPDRMASAKHHAPLTIDLRIQDTPRTSAYDNLWRRLLAPPPEPAPLPLTPSPLDEQHSVESGVSQ